MPGTITLEQLADQLSDGSRRLGDLTPVMREIAKVASDAMYQGVSEGTSPDGSPFTPLRRERTGRGLFAGTPLAGGGLHESLRDGPYHVEEVTSNSVTVGTTHPLAEIHRRGATISRPERRRGPGEKPWVFETEGGATVFTKRIAAHTIVIPAREFIGWSAAALTRAEDLLTGFTAAAVAGEPWTPAGGAP